MCTNNCHVGGCSSHRNNCPAVTMADSVGLSLHDGKILLRTDLKLYLGAWREEMNLKFMNACFTGSWYFMFECLGRVFVTIQVFS